MVQAQDRAHRDPVLSGETGAEQVVTSLRDLHRQVDHLHLPDRAGSLRLIREEKDHLLRLLQAYALPRIEEREAPLIVVIGGPTGAGKSTLTNSLVGSSVSLSGVMRPTTREPVMVYHPLDAAALSRIGLLPGSDGASATAALSLQPVAHDDLLPGLVVIDSPDLDSRLDGNREMAGRLLDIADLWVFVTTGTDYADAMSWDLLSRAADRGISVAVILNRLRENESRPVRAHFAALLRDAKLSHAYMFVLPEARLVEGRVPVQLMSTFQRWLERQAKTSDSRQVHVERALEGAVDQIIASTRRLADAIDDQAVAASRLRVDVEGVYSTAREVVRRRCADGSLLVPELALAWQERYAPVERVPAPSGGGLFRRRQRGQTPERIDHDAAIGRALHVGIEALLREQADQALFRAAERRSTTVDLTESGLGQDFTDRSEAAVRSWLISIHRRLHGADAATDRAERDPLTVTVASRALLPRPGHDQVATGDNPPGDPELIQKVDRLSARRLRELLAPGDEVDAQVQAAWLDLVAALTRVISQEESQELITLQAVPMNSESATELRDRADDLAELRVGAAVHS